MSTYAGQDYIAILLNISQRSINRENMENEYNNMTKYISCTFQTSVYFLISIWKAESSFTCRSHFQPQTRRTAHSLAPTRPQKWGLEHISNKNGSDCLPFVQVGVWQTQQAHLETAVWRTRLPAPPVWVWTGWGLGSEHLAEPEKAMTRSGRAEKAQLAAAV